MQAINWVDNSGAYSAHTNVYDVEYQTTDIFTAACLCRVYFLVEAVLVVLPINLLFSKRVCQEAGFEPDVIF